MNLRQGFPGELPEIPSGWASGQLDLMPGEGFWDRIEQIAVKGEMTRGLDTAMSGKASPRIWLFLHEPGRGELSAAVAMSFARELAFRDQAALILDGDDRDLALTRWVGRVESEGWIDLTRYGTSVLTSGIPMPFVGRRGYVLGVGSFAPTDVTQAEVETLLTRLRRQADDLLIVAPADSLGLLWAPAVDIRIMCWDRTSSDAEHAAVIAADFAAAGHPLTAAVTFQDSGAVEEKIVDEIFAEVDPTVEVPGVPVDVDEPEPAPVAEEPADEPAEEPVEEPVIDEAADSGWQGLPLEEADDEDDPVDSGESEPESDNDGWDGLMPTREPEPAGGTSRVFWFGALAALVVIAAISVYYFKFVRVPSEGHFEQINIATETAPPESGSESVAAVVDSQEAAPLTVGTDSLAVTDSALVEVPSSEDLADTLSASDSGNAEEVIAVLEEAEPEDAPADPPAVFDMAPYQGPVGELGWALHVYSLPDAASTANQVQELERRGFDTSVKVFDLGEKGRWLRIYLGSFASRAEAKAAMPALLEKLREDWAKPERFTTSALE